MSNRFQVSGKMVSGFKGFQVSGKMVSGFKGFQVSGCVSRKDGFRFQGKWFQVSKGFRFQVVFQGKMVSGFRVSGCVSCWGAEKGRKVNEL